MSANLNLKTVFEADTKDLTRGAQQAKKDLKDFGKTSDEVTSSIADAFGVNTAKLDQMGNSARELGRQLSESGNAGVAAFGKMLQSISAAQVAIAGLGIGAAISAFKLLTAEAENFKNTVAGANIEMQTAAYVSTYSQVLHDFNAETGQSVAEFESKWKKAFGRFKANFTQNVVNGLTGNQGLGAALAGPVLSTVFGGNKEQQQAALAAATRAEQITGEMFDLQRQIAAKSVEWAETEAQIAEYRRIAKDDSATMAQQQNAIAQAQALIRQRYGEEYNIRQRMADLQTEMNGLAASSAADEDKQYQLQIQAANVLRNQEQMIKTLNKDQRTLTAQAEKEAAAYAEAAAMAAALADQVRRAREEMEKSAIGKPSSGQSSPGTPGSLVGKATTAMQVTALVRPVLDQKAAKETGLELAQIVSSVASETSEVIGKLIGDLATGGDAWHNFANNALSAFGDMAITVGKMAIGVGLATEAIKESLVALGGVGAIAAGAALVALGTAVKSGLSNVASGNYSASASIASPSYGSAGSTMVGGYATSALNIKVTGTLIGDGSQLKAVIDSENSRRRTVT